VIESKTKQNKDPCAFHLNDLYIYLIIL